VFSSPFPRKASTEPKPPSSQAGVSFEERAFPEGDIFNASPCPRPLSFYSTYNTRSTILLRWATPQSRTGLWRGLDSQRYYTRSIAQGTLGDRGGAITFSTQRAIHSLLVVVLPPAAFALLSILGIWRSSKSL
jgi:hypothetical protein